MTKLLFAVALAGCYHAATPADPQTKLEHDTNVRLGQLRAENPSLDPILNDAFAFAVFRDVGESEIGRGNTVGDGVLYEHGVPSGYIALHQPATGANMNNRNYTELLVLRDASQVALLKAGNLDLIDPPVVFIHGRQPIETPSSGTVALIVLERGARMPVTVAGQQLQFEPRG
jgi:hypothetical protein